MFDALYVLVPVLGTETLCTWFFPNVYVPLAIFPAYRRVEIPWEEVAESLEITDTSGSPLSRSQVSAATKAHHVKIQGIRVRARYRSVHSKGVNQKTGDAWLVVSDGRKQGIWRVRFYATRDALEVRCLMAIPILPTVGLFAGIAITLTAPIALIALAIIGALLYRLLRFANSHFAKDLVRDLSEQIRDEPE